MKQFGEVVNVMNGKAKVSMQKHSSCSNCNACKLGSEAYSLEIEAKNEAKASIGDLVVVDMKGQDVLSAAFILYIIPLIALMLGILLGTQIFPQQELIAALIGFLFMAAAFLVIKSNDHRFKDNPKYVPIIVEVCDEEPCQTS